MIPAVLRRRRGSLLWLIGIVVLAIVLGVLATIPILRGTPDGRIGSLVGQVAPDLEAEDLDGRTWSLTDADGRLVWVNFWAISCEPCRTEMPAMQRLAEAYPDELLILGVDWGEGRDAVTDFVERYGVDYPILLDPTLEIYYRWAGTDGLPRHYFIGAEGTVLREVIGPLDPSRMVAILEELLASS
ncbi:MAG TPA: TlpA disulfide reductase family protein [Candidatus Limnocylindrales bacterium]|nr:TlpA disulfide reductase family protein [Candidatus Limnocylindrales bacterium]